MCSHIQWGLKINPSSFFYPRLHCLEWGMQKNMFCFLVQKLFGGGGEMHSVQGNRWCYQSLRKSWYSLSEHKCLCILLANKKHLATYAAHPWSIYTVHLFVVRTITSIPCGNKSGLKLELSQKYLLGDFENQNVMLLLWSSRNKRRSHIDKSILIILDITRDANVSGWTSIVLLRLLLLTVATEMYCKNVFHATCMCLCSVQYHWYLDEETALALLLWSSMLHKKESSRVAECVKDSNNEKDFTTGGFAASVDITQIKRNFVVLQVFMISVHHCRGGRMRRGRNGTWCVCWWSKRNFRQNFAKTNETSPKQQHPGFQRGPPP